jgi:hypothetical protein
MNEGHELYEVIRRVYERHRHMERVSPASIAIEAMREIQFPPELHLVGYTGCNLQMRQIARSFLGVKFDPVDRAESIEDDLFPETLQDRYPVRTKKGEEPQYVLRESLSDEDADYNIARMRRASFALQKHSDALEAWKLARRSAA